MRNISLYIADKLIELSDDSFILFNYCREDLSNPTIVKNSYTQSITIPGTKSNNKVFGEVFRVDRKTLSSTTRFDGVYFDPTRKTPFAIYATSGEILESGYCKLEQIDVDGDIVSYSVTLYGGLGSFFYALQSDEDGNALSLASLTWKDANNLTRRNFNVTCGTDVVDDAWKYLADGVIRRYAFWNIVNFAPAYNGLPSDFDSKHCLINGTLFDNVPSVQAKDGVNYTYKSGYNVALCTFEKEHTEWELCDLRWYLQRPVVSVRAFFDAISNSENNGGYVVNLDPTFFNNTNNLYWNGWITLPMIAKEDRGLSVCLFNAMSASKTPAEYLVSFAKIFGLVFLWDSGRKEVSILTRASFYSRYANETPIDLSRRLHREDVAIVPTLTEANWYQFGKTAEGEWCSQYEADYGRPYGCQKVNTGYEFNPETKVITDGIIFKDCTEVMESNRMFTSWEIEPDAQGGWTQRFSLPKWEAVTYELWNGANSSKFDLDCPYSSFYYDNLDAEYGDWLPKLQLHSADNKSFDGSDVLMVFEGIRECPLYASSPYNIGKVYYITTDNSAMTDLNGKPCWDLTGAGIGRDSLPSFRRHHLEGEYITETYEWGEPKARPVLGIHYETNNPQTIYARYWRNYLADRFDTDAKTMTAKVDLTGLQVSQDLLRRFFWFDNAIWVINKIVNHSLTTLDMTECELVKVKDVTSYTTSASSSNVKYLTISPSSLSVSVVAEGGTAVFGISSSSAWTLTGDMITGMSVNRSSGSAGIVRLEVTMPQNESRQSRRASLTITNADGFTRVISVVQAGASIVDSRTISFAITTKSVSRTAQTASVDLNCTGAITPSEVSVSSDSSWVSGFSITQKNETTLTISFSIAKNTEKARTAKVNATITATNAGTATPLSITQAQGEATSFSVSPGYIDVPYTANVQTITIKATANWTARVDTGNASLNITSGSAGVNYVQLSIPANYTSSTRHFVIEVKQGTSYAYAEFDQAAYQSSQVDTIIASPISVTLDPQNGSSKSVSVTASASWSVASASSWINASASSYASGTKTLTISARSANYGQSERSGSVVLDCGNASCTIQVTQSNASISVNNDSPTIASDGTQMSVVVTASDTWKVLSSSPSWLTATKDGNNLRLSATNNTSGAERSGSVIVCLVSDESCRKSLAVTQLYQGGEQREDSIITGVVSVAFNPSGDEREVSVYATGAWTLTCPSWITPSISSGSGSADGEIVTLSVSANQSSSRSGSVVFSLTGTSKTASVSVSQDVVGALVVTNPSVSVDHKAQNVTMQWTANCQWKLGTYSESLTPPDTTSGSGNGSMVFAISKNTGTSSRIARVEILYGDNYEKSASMTITQSPASISISSSSGSFAKEGEGKSVTIVADGTWEVVSKPSWIYIEASSYASGTRSITINALTNGYATDRSGTITFGIVGTSVQTRYSCSQGAADEVLEVAQTSWNVDYQAHSVNFGINCNTHWEIVDISEGLTFNLTSGYLNGGNVWNVIANGTPGVKTYTATIRTTSGEVERTITITQEDNVADIVVSVQSLEFDEDNTTRQFTIRSDRSWSIETTSSWVRCEPSAGLADQTYTIVATARLSLTDIQNAVIKVNSGVSQKTITCKSYPPIETTNEE